MSPHCRSLCPQSPPWRDNLSLGRHHQPVTERNLKLKTVHLEQIHQQFTQWHFPAQLYFWLQMMCVCITAWTHTYTHLASPINPTSSSQRGDGAAVFSAPLSHFNIALIPKQQQRRHAGNLPETALSSHRTDREYLHTPKIKTNALLSTDVYPSRQF